MRRTLTSAGLISLLLSLAPALVRAAEAEKKGMPQLDPSSYPSQIFWLAVFFALFYGFMLTVAMPRLHRILEARQARISDDLNHATTASGDAAQLKAELDLSLALARDQARTVVAAANDDIRTQATARDASLSAELATRIETAEASIQAARAQAMSSIEDIASGILLEALPKVASVSPNGEEARSAVSRAAGARK